MINCRSVQSPVSSSTVVLRLAGEIDIGNAAALASCLDGLPEAAAGDVVVDVSQVTFMACAGLRPLLKAHRELGDRLWLQAPSRSVRRLLELTGLLTTFQVVTATGTDPSTGTPETPGLVLSGAGTSGGRTTIEQARGILMGVHGCDADGAQQLLEQAAARGLLSIRDVATALTVLSVLVADRAQGEALWEALRALLPESKSRVRATTGQPLSGRTTPV